jgi:hypothetical protein
VIRQHASVAALLLRISHVHKYSMAANRTPAIDRQQFLGLMDVHVRHGVKHAHCLFAYVG